MLKKIISTAICAGIIAAGVVLPVSAATQPVELTGWSQSFISNTDYDSEKTGIEFIESYPGADGHACLHMFTSENKMYVRAKQTINGLEPGKNYRLSGKFKTNGSGYRCTMRFGDDSSSRTDLNNLSGYTSGEWFEFSHDFEFNYNSTIFTIHLESDGNDKYIYADNLSIREVIGEDQFGPELLVNGDFENYVIPDEPSFVQAAPANGVNYINIKTESPVNIYQVTDTGEQKLDLGTSVYSYPKYKLNVYQHDGLTNGQNYTYIVKTVSADGIESEGVTVSATPSEEYSIYRYLDGWSYKNNGSGTNYNYGKVTIEQGKGIDGGAVLQASNMTDSFNYGNLYIKNRKSFSLKSGKTYKLTYWEKDGEHNGSASSIVAKINNSRISKDGETYSNTNSNVDVTMSYTDGQWHQQTLYLKAAGEENAIEFTIYRHYESLLLDKFEVYEVDAETLEVVPGALNLMADDPYAGQKVSIEKADLTLNGDVEGVEENNGILTSGENSFYGYKAVLQNDNSTRTVRSILKAADSDETRTPGLDTAISSDGEIVIYIITDRELDTANSTVIIE